MDKIIFKNATIEIEESSGAETFVITFASLTQFNEVIQKLSPENLEAYQVQNQEGLTVANPTNKECLHVGINLTWEGGAVTKVRATFHISDVDMIAKTIKELQESQAVQDGAIEDVGAVISTIAEQMEGGAL